MRKVYLFMMVTLDGFFEGPGHNIDWHNTDEEFNQFAEKQTGEAGTILFGRRTYQLMASYWPTEEAIKDDPIIAGYMNKTPKMVFSTTLDKSDYQNTTLIKEHAAKEVAKLKHQEGKDIVILGSNNLTVRLMEEGLVDEFRIMINPIIIGAGTRLFAGLKNQQNLKLVSTRTFRNGNILLTYQKPRDT